jgi:hypothetical protein
LTSRSQVYLAITDIGESTKLPRIDVVQLAALFDYPLILFEFAKPQWQDARLKTLHRAHISALQFSAGMMTQQDYYLTN